MGYDSLYPTFRPAAQAGNRLGRTGAPRSSCGDALCVNAIRSSAMDVAASRRTMSITTGSKSGAVAATVAGRPSPSSRCFLSLTPITACWLDVRRCGDASWSTAPGKRRCPRSKTLIACPTPPPSAAGLGGLDPSQPARSFLRRTLARLAPWLARGSQADPDAGPLSGLTPVLQVLWPLRL